MKILKTLAFFALGVGLLTSCGGGKPGGDKEVALKEAKGYYKEGDKKYKIYLGGIFRINEVEKFKNLFPQANIDATSSRILSQIYQGLYKFNQRTLEPELCLAESFEANEDASVWTFKIRKGVFFQDNECFSGGKGREMTAADVKYSLDQLCIHGPNNPNASILTDHVVGAQEYSDNPTGPGVKGIELLSDNSIRFSLNKAYSSFNSVLAHGACMIFPKEAIEYYGEDISKNPVGTGPFFVNKIDDNQVLLKKNPTYWEQDEHGNQLPYLDIVKITFTADKKSELNNFKKNNLDVVWKLPVDALESVLNDLQTAIEGGNPEYKYQQVNGLSTQFYAFNAVTPMFQNKDVRKAFNMAIDREGLIKHTMKGEGEPALHGFVPKMPLYNNSSIEGFEYNPKEAKILLANAGYPGGKGFPDLTLYLNEGGKTNMVIANAIYNNLKDVLGIEINIEPLPQSILIERFATGNTDFARTAWIADIPDPADFLKLFYGKNVPSDPNARSLPNFSRYTNDTFDKFFEAGMAAVDQEVKNNYFNKCDSILVEDAAVIPLFHDQYSRLIQNNVVGFPINAIEYRDLTRVFKTKETK